MCINVYPIIERAVFEGLALGLAHTAQTPEGLHDQVKTAETLLTSVMNELHLIIDFGVEPVPTTEQFNQLQQETE